MAALSDSGGCVFCDIVAGREEASVVHEDEHVIAFMDIQPVTEGHVLVVPRVHAGSLEDLDEDLGARVFRAAHRLARALRRSGLPCEGVNMFLADGAAAFQEVFHAHLHVFPRIAGDGFVIDARWRLRDRADLDASAEQVRRGVRALSSLLGAFGRAAIAPEIAVALRNCYFPLCFVPGYARGTHGESGAE
jgi:diadenosine tetraphosphate (Ap4A) HIT family hydrolase